jgi:hypothetical protein
MDPDRDELAVRALGQYYGLVPAFTRRAGDRYCSLDRSSFAGKGSVDDEALMEGPVVRGGDNQRTVTLYVRRYRASCWLEQRLTKASAVFG